MGGRAALALLRGVTSGTRPGRATALPSSTGATVAVLTPPMAGSQTLFNLVYEDRP